MFSLWVSWGLPQCYGWTLVPDEHCKGLGVGTKTRDRTLRPGHLTLDCPHALSIHISLRLPLGPHPRPRVTLSSSFLLLIGTESRK